MPVLGGGVPGEDDGDRDGVTLGEADGDRVGDGLTLGEVEGERDGVALGDGLPEPGPTPVTWPFPPSKTTSEQP